MDDMNAVKCALIGTCMETERDLTNRCPHQACYSCGFYYRVLAFVPESVTSIDCADLTRNLSTN
jgi:hypothetical protein